MDEKQACGHELAARKLNKNGHPYCAQCIAERNAKRKGVYLKTHCDRGHDLSVWGRITGRKRRTRSCGKCAADDARLRNYGTPAEQIAVMADHQGGLCAVPACGNSWKHVDHNHGTEKVRGLTCIGCNTRLIVALEKAPFLALGGLIYLLERGGLPAHWVPWVEAFVNTPMSDEAVQAFRHALDFEF